MGLTANQKSNFISLVREQSGEVIDLVNNLRTTVDRYNAGGYSIAVVDEDFTGVHEGKTAAEFQAAITSFSALLATFDGGHDTNLEKIRD